MQRERIAPRAARVTSVSPFQRERRAKRVSKRRRKRVGKGRGTGFRLGRLGSGKEDSGEGGEKSEDGFKDFHFMGGLNWWIKRVRKEGLAS